MTKRISRWAMACASIAAVATLTACGTTKEATTTHDHGPESFAALIQQAYQGDYEPFDTPDALLAATDIALTGVVASLTDGSVEETASGPLNNIRIGIAPDGSSSKSIVYAELPRPGNWGVEKYAAELPTGLRIGLIGYLPDLAPKDDPFYIPAPQGMFLESSDGKLLGVVDNIDDFGPGWSSTSTMDDLAKVIASSKTTAR